MLAADGAEHHLEVVNSEPSFAVSDQSTCLWPAPADGTGSDDDDD